eukprot:80110_1
MQTPLDVTWPNKEQLHVSDTADSKQKAKVEKKWRTTTICFACFAVFNDIIILPLIFIWMLYVIKNPLFTDGFLCQCCEGHGVYSCLEKETECCCDCKSIGNTLFGTPFQITFLMYCVWIGLFELALLTKAILVFVYHCLCCKSLKYACIGGLSLRGFRFTKDMMIIALIARLSSFIWIISILITNTPLNCSCYYPGAVHEIYYGSQYIRYNELMKVMNVHVLFCGLFLLSRPILLCMIKHIKIDQNMIALKLHYIQIDSLYKKNQ